MHPIKSLIFGYEQITVAHENDIFEAEKAFQLLRFNYYNEHASCDYAEMPKDQFKDHLERYMEAYELPEKSRAELRLLVSNSKAVKDIQKFRTNSDAEKDSDKPGYVQYGLVAKEVTDNDLVKFAVCLYRCDYKLESKTGWFGSHQKPTFSPEMLEKIEFEFHRRAQKKAQPYLNRLAQEYNVAGIE